MSATVAADANGSFDWFGDSSDDFPLTLTSAAPLVVYEGPLLITAVEGNNQRARLGMAYPSALVALVTDATNTPVAGVDVAFDVPHDPGVTLNKSTAKTDSLGRASVTATATNNAGAYTVQASVSDSPESAYFGLFNIPAPGKLSGTVSYSPPTIAPGAQSTATIRIQNTTGSTINRSISTSDLPALPSGVTFVGQPDLGGCDFSAMPLNNMNVCNMFAVVTAASVGNYQWTGDGQTNDNVNVYIALSNAVGLGVYGATSAIVVDEGDGQTITVGQDFEALWVKVTDANGTAIPGATVNFTAPSSGAGLAEPNSVSITDAAGLAGIMPTANQTAGSYQINANVAGVASPAVFQMTNAPAAPASVLVTSGNNQAATISTAFANPLVTTVLDEFNNPVAGQTVTFTAPSGGASGTFDTNPQTVTTASNGTATAPTFTANAAIGSYTVVASLQSGASTSFSLENKDLPVTAGAVSLSVAANSSANPITLNLSGGAANTVAVVGAATHGTATASGAAITYTPTAGYSGGDSFTYTATNGTGTSTAATVTITVIPPFIAITPTSLPGGTAGTAYSQTITAANGTPDYTFAVTGGALPTGLTLASGGTLSGTPSARGTFPVTVTAMDSLGAVGSRAYLLQIAEQAVTANDVSVTLAANSSDNSITLSLSGGAADTVAVVSPASHGMAAASGTAITYTPMAGYSGTDSFTYIATNSSGTSTPATVSITVTAATLLLTPTSLPDGTVGTVYGQIITAAGGTEAYTYVVTAGALPSGLALASDGTLSGTPSAYGQFNLTITATDSLGATGSRAYSLQVAEQAVAANAVSATVAANSSANPITLNLSGGAANTVAVASAASHGTATALGTAISYTPTDGYSGTDSFTYTATNSVGTSTAATVSITVTPPTLVLTPTLMPDGRVGTGYNQTFSASGGTEPYSYAVSIGALPASLTLGGGGTLSGTPSAQGTSSFTVTATDIFGATGTLAVDLNIQRQPNVLVFTPSSGALPNAMAGEAYSTTVTATGGVAPIVYRLTSGAMPAGMALNITTGELTGPLDPETHANYGFNIEATDSNGDTGTASYTIAVVERVLSVTDKQVTVTPGATPTNVNLEAGATGGPFISADIVSVEPPNGGTAQIVMGEFAQTGGSTPVSFYLKFTPNPAFTGQVVVRFTLASSLGTSNPGLVVYNLGYDPVAVAQQVQTAVQGFVETRQDLVASTVKVPGLVERRAMASASEPMSGQLSPSGDGLVLNFATSLVQANAAANAAAGVIDVGEQPFNMWANGTIMVHNRSANGNRWGSFGMLSAGVDYLLNDKTLVGLSFHYDHMTDPTDADTLLTGQGWLVGPYASVELGDGVFWDSSLLYGGSSNAIDTDLWDGNFGTSRWLLDTAISGQWKLDEVTTLTPKLRAVYLNEAVQSYTVENGAGGTLVLDGFTSEQLRFSLGAEIARQFLQDNGSTLTPKLGVTGGVSGLGGSGAFGSVAAGLNWQSFGALSIDSGLLFNIDGEGSTSSGARVGVSGRF